MNPLLLTDGYKTSHHQMYPKGTNLVYSNFTPRSNKYGPKGADKVVSFGQQMMMTQIHEAFEKEFFQHGLERDLTLVQIKKYLILKMETDLFQHIVILLVMVGLQIQLWLKILHISVQMLKFLEMQEFMIMLMFLEMQEFMMMQEFVKICGFNMEM